MILLHYTGMPEADAALERLCSPESKVSTHYFVYEDGRVVQCVPEALRAWHAGDSGWAGAADINSCSIGVEIANPGHSHGYPNFPRRQIAAVIALCRGIIARRAIRPDRIVGHSDVAPMRKQDPGEKFPWRLLHESGVGLWVKPVRIAAGGHVVQEGQTGEVVRLLQTKLADYGYALAPDGAFGEVTRRVVEAFQRHYRPERIDGIADDSTRETLARLLAARDEQRRRANSA
jgi:N-acetylmuramoyl-L-alanine amidase